MRKLRAGRLTDLEAALDKVAANPGAHDGPVVLVTDGWETRGDAERALGAIRSAGVRLYIFTPPGARGIPNVAITGLAMPPALEKSESFALGVTTTNYNSAPVGGTISIFKMAARSTPARSRCKAVSNASTSRSMPKPQG